MKIKKSDSADNSYLMLSSEKNFRRFRRFFRCFGLKGLNGSEFASNGSQGKRSSVKTCAESRPNSMFMCDSDANLIVRSLLFLNYPFTVFYKINKTAFIRKNYFLSQFSIRFPFYRFSKPFNSFAVFETSIASNRLTINQKKSFVELMATESREDLR